ncbi:UNVERIFIED_CONTAM: putative AC transposase [Sesamum radiatum]|uniref:AC transposase n=1 Tax=Sesamum radiatum TaxID=300843 RepID=A0AAW2R1L0_SESRA
MTLYMLSVIIVKNFYLVAANGTTHLKKHLNNACPKFKLEHRIDLSGSPRNEFKFDQVKSRKDLTIACIKHKYPFNIGEHEYFEIFLNGLNPDFKLPRRNTIRGDVIEVYEEEKVKVYKLLDGLGCKVSLTTDIWTSDHSHVAYCCLTAHFVDNSWELQKKILAFRKMSYPHDGETLFNFMKEMILEWNLDKKLFSVVVDNATNNDVMIRKVKDWILYDLLVARDVDLLHVRCSAHILNLIVQDGLNEIRGLIDKIRETVRYLNKSPAASQKFEMALNQCNLTDKRKVAMDVPNR